MPSIKSAGVRLLPENPPWLKENLGVKQIVSFCNLFVNWEGVKFKAPFQIPRTALPSGPALGGEDEMEAERGPGTHPRPPCKLG